MNDIILEDRLKKYAVYLFTSVIIIEILVLCSWQFKNDILTKSVFSLYTTNPTTALCLIVSCIAYRFINFEKKNLINSRVGIALAILIFVIGLLRFSTVLSGTNFYGDSILFPGKVASGTFYDHMSPTSAFNFMIVAVLLFLSQYRSEKIFFITQALAIVIAVSALLSIISYIYRVDILNGALKYIVPSFYASVSFLALSVAVLFSHPEKAIMSIYTSSLTGSKTSRAILPMAILIPIVLGYIRLLGTWSGTVSVEFGVALLVMGIVFVFVIYITGHAILLNKIDIQTRNDKKRSEQIEREYQFMIGSVKDYAIFKLDIDGIVTNWNKGAEIIKGYSANEIIGKSMKVFYIPEDIANGEPERNLKIASEKGHHETEGWRVRKDGSRFYANIAFSALFDEEGKLNGYAKVTKDITEKRRTEERLIFLATIAENIQDPIISTDNNALINRWNNAAENLFGWKSEEAIGKLTNEVLQVIYPSQSRAEILDSFSTKGFWQGEVIYHTKSGSPVYVLATASHMKDVNGKVTGNLVLARDITARKNAEEQLEKLNQELEQRVKERTHDLRLSEAFNRGILNSLSSHIAVVDATGKIVSVNHSWEKFAKENGDSTLTKTGAGINYFTVCENSHQVGDESSGAALQGMKDVVEEKLGHYYLEYTCHSATQERWFALRVMKFYSDEPMIVVSHQEITDRKNAEENVIKTLNDKNIILESIADAFFAVDTNWTVTYWNRVAERDLEVSREIILNKNLWDIFSDSVGSTSYKKYHEAIETKLVVHFEDHYPALNKWYEITAYPSENGLSVYFKDITERKKAEKALKDEKDLFFKLIVTVPGTICTFKLSPDGSASFPYSSPAMFEIMGIKPEELTQDGAALMRKIHPDDIEIVQKAIFTSAQNMTKFQAVYRFENPQKGWIWIEAISLPSADLDGSILWTGFFSDITERKKAEEKVKESDIRYRSIVEQATDAICITDGSLRFIDVNPYACDLFGYTKEEVLQLSLQDILFKEDLITNPLKTGEVATGKSVINERRLKRKDGMSIDMEVSTKMMEDGRLIMFGHDITARNNEISQKAVLADISQLFNEGLNLHATLEKVVQRITLITEFSLAETWLVDEDKKRITLFAKFPSNKATRTFYKESIDTKSFEKGEGLPGITWQTKAVQCWRHIDEDPRFIRKDAAKKSGLSSAYGIPVIYNKEVIGVLILALTKDMEKPDRFSAFFENLALHMGSEIRRKQLEEELDQIFNFAPDIICILGTDGYFKKINPAASHLLGYSASELLAVPYRNFIFPGDVGSAENYVTLVERTNVGAYAENRYITQSGKVVWLAWTTTPSPQEGLIFAIAKDITEKKELENLLAKTSAIAGLGSWEVNLVKGSVFWSDITKKIHETAPGYIADLATGIHFYKEGPSRDIMREKITEAIGNGTAFDIEVQIVTAKKNERWVRVIGETEMINNKCVKVFGSFQDIDARKKAEEKVKESEAKYRSLIEQAGDAIFILDKDLKYIDVNPSGCKLTGYPKEEMLKLTGADILFDEDVKITPLSMDELNSGKSISHERRMKRKDGTPVLVDINAKRLEDGRIIVFARDISERKKAEDQIFKLSRLYLFIGQINEMIIRATDEETLFKEACRIAVDYGNFKMAWIGKVDEKTKIVVPIVHAGEEKGYLSSIKIISVKDAPEGRGPTGTALREGRYIVCNDIENDLMMLPWKKAALDRGFLSSMSLPIIKFGKVVGAFTFYAAIKGFFDINEIELLEESANNVGFALELFDKEKLRKAAEEEVITLNAGLEEKVHKRTEELKKANEEMEAFSYSVSHDLRAPLRGIVGFTTILEEDYTSQLDEEARRITTVIKNNTLKMGTLIDDLLTFSRMGRKPVERINIKTNELVQEIIHDLENKKEQHNIEWNIQQLPLTYADLNTIMQVWINLVSNAVKYSGKNEHPKIEIGAEEKNRETIFFVRDNGVGFDEKYSAKLFKVFQRLHANTDFEGTGVGLAIVEKIITKHGGRVWAEGVPGKGATFYFSLPKQIQLKN
jgi:PAS domain S-box-containing protein